MIALVGGPFGGLYAVPPEQKLFPGNMIRVGEFRYRLAEGGYAEWVGCTPECALDTERECKGWCNRCGRE